jgi:hypothetical protein
VKIKQFIVTASLAISAPFSSAGMLSDVQLAAAMTSTNEELIAVGYVIAVADTATGFCLRSNISGMQLYREVKQFVISRNDPIQQAQIIPRNVISANQLVILALLQLYPCNHPK